MNIRRAAQAALAILLAVCLPAAANHLEVKGYAITDWPASGVCQGGDRPSWDNMARGWYDELRNHSTFFGDGFMTDGTFNQKVLCDPDLDSPCDDHHRIDDADAAILALHGADLNQHWRGTLRVATDGDCRIEGSQGASTDELSVGDMDLEFLVLSSCNSMDDDNINWIWHNFQDVDSASNGRRLHQMDGFHGVMWISSGRVDDYEDFGHDGHYVSIRTAFTDNLYDTNVFDNDGNGPFDQCPVAYTVAPSFPEALTRLLYERYNFIFSDPGPVGAAAISFYDGCFPSGDDPFNDPNQ